LKKIIPFCILLTALHCYAQRVVVPLNDNWQFIKDSTVDPLKGPVSGWQTVNLPHTWNIADVMDDQPGYYRGIGWYKKIVDIPAQVKGRQYFIYFEGANQQTTVFVNGKKAGSHIGGYTAFCIAITPLLDPSGKNELLVKVDNSYNENIAPLSADFTFYGGIYRQVSLIATSDIHFSLMDNASKAVYISTPQVSAIKASISIRTNFINESPVKRKLRISTIIGDRQHIKRTEVNTFVTVDANESNDITQDIAAFNAPHLWSPEDPYLYTATTTITDASTGELLDEVNNSIGFRWFKFDAGKGFFLNGKSYKLIGTSRHQDYKDMGNAVPKKLAIDDIALIKNTGANFFRVAHYPQDPAVMEACDRLGLLSSVEIPLVNEITESTAFYNNCMHMQVEMIRQNYNHPSVIIWCYMNEILLRPHFSSDKERQKIYFAAITKLAVSLDSITRKEDPYRYTMIANHADFNKYSDNQLTSLAMITGWNLYSGWYSGTPEDFPAFLDRHHEKLPQQPFMITEYGADADNRIRSLAPLRFDKSVEYTTKFHQFYITEIMKRPFVAGAVVWNLADFNSETRTETMPHINNKGLLTWDRIPKDPYYLYQAVFSKKPFVKITAAGWRTRGGVADSTGEYCYQPLQAASNLNALQLKMNGKTFAAAKVEHGLASWQLPFINGVNNIVVWGIKGNRVYRDTLSINFLLEPYVFTNSKTAFKQMNILLGATRYFIDSAQQLWIPCQAYRTGSWGCIGGRAFIIENNNRLPYGTDRNILGTVDDPVYQTQQAGIKAFCFDVPEGNYEISLYFAELQGGLVKYPPYNLSDTARDENTVKRIFNVYINNEPFLQNFNMAKEYGITKAIIKKTTIAVTKNNGITIAFKAIEGEPVLNALQLKKLD
jgi:beta-galactosidase